MCLATYCCEIKVQILTSQTEITTTTTAAAAAKTIKLDHWVGLEAR